MSVKTSDLMEMFVFETSQNIKQLEQIILNTEKNEGFSESEINEIFRLTHTIKGTSAMMSYTDIAEVAHKAEDLFFFIRENPGEPYDCFRVSDIMLNCVDYISGVLEKASLGEKEGVQKNTSLISEIEKALCEINSPRSALAKRGEMSIDIKAPFTNAFRAMVYFDEECGMENLRAFSLLENMKDESVSGYSPHGIFDDQSSLYIRKKGFLICFESKKSYGELHKMFLSQPFVREVDLNLTDIEKCLEQKRERETLLVLEGFGGGTAKLPEARNPSNKQENHNTPPYIISLNVSKLDKLIKTVGEIARAEALVAENPDLVGLELPSFKREANKLHKKIAEMQDIVTSMRLVPLAATFQKLHRVVRDISKRQNKVISLELFGEEIELDKKIIEQLSDPLMHLVRNAVDHGIEDSEVRLANGKERRGVITLGAYGKGGEVNIVVKDDGRGLDTQKILEKAKQNNLLPVSESQLTEKEIHSLIFLPGFSTNESITEFSGRGVGLDVVTQNISSVGGTLSVESEKNKGTAITIKIPIRPVK